MANDDRLLYNYRPPPRPQPTPAEALWTLTRDARTTICRLRMHPGDACDLQLFRDGEFASGRRFGRRDQAIAYAESYRQQLIATGWVGVSLSRDVAE